MVWIDPTLPTLTDFVQQFEPGAETMEELLVAAGKKDAPLHMTDVNYTEVKYSIVKKEGAEAWTEALKILQGLPIDFHSTSRALADTAADLKARYKISLAGAFAAALAKEKKAELVSGDPGFKPLEKEIKIHWLKWTRTFGQLVEAQARDASHASGAAAFGQCGGGARLL